MPTKLLAGQLARAYMLAVFGVLLPLCASASAQSRDLAEVRARADECSQAFLKGDFEKFIRLTYPKVVEVMGGKKQLAAYYKLAYKEVKAQPFKIVSFTAEPPREIVRAGTKLVAIVPTTMRMRGEAGVVTTKSFLIGVADAAGRSKWTFLGGSYLDEASLGIYLPEAVGKIVLPKQPEPVFEKASEGPGAPD